MYAIYMVTFTINIPPMLAYIPDMDPMGYIKLYQVGGWKSSKFQVNMFKWWSYVSIGSVKLQGAAPVYDS